MKRFKATFCLTVTLLLTPLCWAPQLSAADFVGSTPKQWPRNIDGEPALVAWPNAMRIAGSNRYGTSLSAALLTRGGGQFPFDDLDDYNATSSLSDANYWWGLSSCPRAVIVVASDSPADAVVAGTLSDPSGNSREPYLRRSASADPLFNPPGGYDRVDAELAPILLTPSGRSGAENLGAAVTVAVRDFRRGGCTSARTAVIVGGHRAVPEGVEDDLLRLGVREVFRVAGTDRYETAMLVAIALGTEGLLDSKAVCKDLSPYGFGFYANSVVERRRGPDHCELLPRTVVLTDGVDGVDALSSGWWTSHWQVPVLLHDGSSKLPSSTRRALESLEVDNLIIVGGPDRVPSSVGYAASRITAATLTRVAGSDRYATSVLMAQEFGGWWPSSSAANSAGSLICVVASGGQGSTQIGWPDALVAGPWCAAASARGSNPAAPRRYLPPILGDYPRVSGNDRALAAVPIVLVKPGDEALPRSVDEFLRGVFTQGDAWCSSEEGSGGCHDPGFAFVFGGDEVTKDGLIDGLSILLAGGDDRSTGSDPQVTDLFATSLSMAPNFHDGDVGVLKLCTSRDGYSDARWLAVVSEVASSDWVVTDIFGSGYYLQGPTGQPERGPTAHAVCVPVPDGGEQGRVQLSAIGLDGRWGDSPFINLDPIDRVVVASTITSGLVISRGGLPLTLDTSAGGQSKITFKGEQSAATTLHRSGIESPILEWDLFLTIDRGIDSAHMEPDRFEISFVVADQEGVVSGTASGEAYWSGGSWFLRGQSQLISNDQQYFGGFSLDLISQSFSSGAETISWRFDGFPR